MTTPIPLTARPDETNLTGVNEHVGASVLIQQGQDTYITRGDSTYITRGGSTYVAHNTYTSTPVFLTARQDDVNLTAREENG